jgi:hypothetical protein
MPSEPSADKVFRARSDGSGSLGSQHSQHSTPKQTQQPAAFPSGLSKQMKPVSFSTKKSKMNSNAIGNNNSLTGSHLFTLSCSRLLLVGLFLLAVSLLQVSELLLIYICNFHHLLLIYICKLHLNLLCGSFLLAVFGSSDLHALLWNGPLTGYYQIMRIFSIFDSKC